MFNGLIQLLKSKGVPPKVEDWFLVTFDERSVLMKANPPGRRAWSQSFDWSDVVRVCYQAEGWSASDGIYVFTHQRPESYAIPIEARGGSELWAEIIRRKLFSAELAIQAASVESGVFIWPPVEEHQ